MRFAALIALALLLAACDGAVESGPSADAPQPAGGSPATETVDAPALRTDAEALAADVLAGERMSCEAAARLYESTERVPDVPSFIAARSDVLAGLDPSLIGGGDGTEVQGFDDSGFRDEFRDGSNQVRHLAAAIQAGVTLGPAAALLHRVLRPDTPQDEALNDVGTTLGAAIVSGEITLAAAGDWIRDNICG